MFKPARKTHIIQHNLEENLRVHEKFFDVDNANLCKLIKTATF